MGSFPLSLAGGLGGDASEIDFLTPTPDTAPGAPGGFSLAYAVAKNTPITLQILQAPILFATVWATLPDGTVETVYDGANFVGRYIAGSTQVASPGDPGIVMSIARTGGWPGASTSGRTFSLTVKSINATDASILSSVAYYDMPPQSAGTILPVEVPVIGAVDMTAEAISKLVWQFRS